MSRKIDLSVYVILDRDFTAGRTLIEIAQAAIRGGATVFQLRDKSSDIHRFHADALALEELTHAAGIPLIINDRVDIGIAVDADGVHVGEDDLPVDVTRRLIGPEKIIGASAGSIEAARVAIAAGADHLGVGPVYEARSTKADAGPPVGLALIREITHQFNIPCVGIGGITATSAAEVIAAGADGVAVISAIGLAPDVEDATRHLAMVVRDAKGRRSDAAGNGRRQ